MRAAQSRQGDGAVLYREDISTPLGRAVALAGEDGGLRELMLTQGDADPPWLSQSPALPAAVASGPAASTLSLLRDQLEAYFAGRLESFSLPLAAHGSEFQQRVWAELLRIPFGQTISYGELARRLGDPKCIRAAGRANGANPIWIIIPCHRVIGADGSLTGYGGGIEVKRRLLELEGALLAL